MQVIGLQILKGPIMTHLPDSLIPRAARIPLNQHGPQVAAPESLDIHGRGQVFELTARQTLGFVIQLSKRREVTFFKRSQKNAYHHSLTQSLKLAAILSCKQDS